MQRRGLRELKKLSFPVIAASAFNGDGVPAEFRIFAKGVNRSVNGDVLFDDVAARSVMLAYKDHGVSPIIDLEHLSLEDATESRNFDPDARGSFDLELRNGELWAVNVKWTSDGLERLANKTQRFFSPAFAVEKTEDGRERVTCLVNVALCAQPALDHLQPLVAASRRTGDRTMIRLFDLNADQDMLPAIAEAMGLDASSPLADILAAVSAWLKEMTDALQGQQPPADGGDTPGANDGTGDPAAMRMSMARAIVTKLSVAASSRSDKSNDKALVAFRSSILRATDATTTEEAREAIDRYKAAYITKAQDEKKIADERRALEATEQYESIKKLAQRGAFTPVQAWAKDANGIPQGPNDGKGVLGKISTFASRFTLAELREMLKDTNDSSRIPSDVAAAIPTTAVHSFEIKLSSGKTRTVDLDDTEVRLMKKRLGAKASDPAALNEALKKYATMKANVDAKAGKNVGVSQ